MTFIFGFFLIIGFIFLVVFGAHFVYIRIELEKKGYQLSFFYIWILPDLIKFKELISIEKDKKKKNDYLILYNWCVYSLISLILCFVILIIIFSILTKT